MAIEELVQDPNLLTLLQTSQSTLSRSLSILLWLHEKGLSTAAPSPDLQVELLQQQRVLHAYLAKLRGQHRRAAFGARATKQETATARQEVDRLLLQLQNLYYEQRHLVGEIDACEGYEYVFSCIRRQLLITGHSHAYTHLPLVPPNDYLTLFPDQSKLSEQEMMPLRIEHEKTEREKMEQQRLELVRIKETLAKENARKKDELRKIDEKLEAMIDGFSPLEEALQRDI